MAFIKVLLYKFKNGRLQTAVAIILLVILSVFIYFTYNSYRKTIVTQQLQNMLGNAKSISRSIELFINDTVSGMNVITTDKEFVKAVSDIEQGKSNDLFKDKIKTYFQAGGDEVEAVYFFDSEGKLLTNFPESTVNLDKSVLEDIQNALAKRSTYIGNAYMDKNKDSFLLNIYEPVFDGGALKGVVSAAINLDIIYDKLIAPVKVGEKGYALVKDQQGIIIMHTVKEQVGMDVIESRKQVYPDLDYTELESLIDAQLKGQEGTAIYHSYWWGDNVLKKVKKLNAYTPVKLGEHFWVVALTMSYDEIQVPINKFLIEILGIVSLIAIIILFFVSALIRVQKNKEELEKETNYLKMLNETSEQLRKEEAEMYHSHKLKMVGTLAGGIAHDINNLLTPILGYSELLLMQIPEEGEYHEEIDEIYKASQKGKELIEQILLFSRKDNGIVKVEPIDINEVTKETLKLLRAVTPKTVAIKENIKEHCGYVQANFTQLHQIIFNLCTNAYQALKDKKGTIEVCLDTVEGIKAKEVNVLLKEDKNYVELIVKDTGCGMDEETKTRIFDPFFTTKEVGEGTGLGLFVVQSIIDKYEGAITVESELGVGSCFKVYLPLIDEETAHKQLEGTLTDIGTNKKILVVDDNENVVKMLVKGLEHLGYQVYSETESLKALERVIAKPDEFDLVITDFMMPKLKGSELAASIKRINSAIKIVLITGYMDKSLEALKNNNSVDECISKPIQLSKLSEAIKRLLTE